MEIGKKASARRPSKLRKSQKVDTEVLLKEELERKAYRKEFK